MPPTPRRDGTSSPAHPPSGSPCRASCNAVPRHANGPPPRARDGRAPAGCTDAPRARRSRDRPRPAVDLLMGLHVALGELRHRRLRRRRGRHGVLAALDAVDHDDRLPARRAWWWASSGACAGGCQRRGGIDDIEAAEVVNSQSSSPARPRMRRHDGAVTVTGWCQLRVASSFLL